MTAEEIKEAENIRNHVNNMIDETFKKLTQIYNRNNDNTNSIPIAGRLIFPNYRDNKNIRISEQELRFVFTEVFNEYCNNNAAVGEWCYSVETPTMERYNFKGKRPRLDPNGKSASFDFVIHDKESNRICLIEFKARNSGKFEHHKDFFKLTEDPKNVNYPPYTQCYFLEVLNGYDEGTKTSITDKLTDYQKYLINYKNCDSPFETPQIRFCFYSLQKQDVTSDIISIKTDNSVSK